MATDPAWTIDQLSELVAAALSSGYPGQSNGRVRQVPDVRTIRWYTSIGLLDRPAALRGRTALYGERHLAQIVAVKRLQADGYSLADVQERLIGADDATLERIAQLPRSAPSPRPAAADDDKSASVQAADAEPPTVRGRFWSTPPPKAEVAAPVSPARPVAAAPPSPALEHERRHEHAPEHAPVLVPSVPLVRGIRLSDDVTLLLSANGDALDQVAVAAVEAAARPLLAELRRLGLTTS